MFFLEALELALDFLPLFFGRILQVFFEFLDLFGNSFLATGQFLESGQYGKVFLLLSSLALLLSNGVFFVF